MPLSSSGSSIKSLSIYPDLEENGHSSVETRNDSQWKGVSSKTSFGTSTMTLVSEVKVKYNNVLKKIQCFKDYATSTEGKVKLSIMFGGLMCGGFLSYRSQSKYRLYKRLMPVGTLTLATAVCYPYTTWDVLKACGRGSVFVYHGSVAAYHGTKKGITYLYDTLQTSAAVETESNRNEKEDKETVYTYDEKGDLSVTEEKISSSSITLSDEKDDPNSDSPATVRSLLPSEATLKTSNAKPNSAAVGDPGQGSPEDSSLYTTRS